MNKDEEFKNRETTKKGDIGQIIYRKRMAKLHPDLKLYSHGQQNIGSHMFDGFIMNRDGSLRGLYDVKTKPRRCYYQDTGIDFRSYKNYVKASSEYKTRFSIVFVDQQTGQIYCGDLINLSKKRNINGFQYPLLQHSKEGEDIIYFPLSQMKILDYLTDQEISQIQSKSSMSDSYKHSYRNNKKLKTVKQILMEKEDGNLF